MNFTKRILYFVIVFTVVFSYYAKMLNYQSNKNISVYVDLLDENYSVLQIHPASLAEINIDDIIENFDVFINLEGVGYSNSITKVENLYGTFKECVVPFSLEDNDCGYFAISKYTYVNGFDKLENFKIKDKDQIYKVVIYIENSQVEDFKKYFNKEYPSLQGMHSIRAVSEMGFVNYSHVVKFNALVLLLIFVVMILTIVQSIKDMRKNIVVQIHSSPSYSLMRNFVLKNVFVDLILLVILYGMLVLLVYIHYSNKMFMWDYIDFSFQYIITVIILSLFIAISTYFIVNYEKVENYLKRRSLVLKSFVILIASFIILNIGVFVNFNTNDLKMSASRYIDYQIVKEFTSYSRYTFYDLSNKDPNEIEELLDGEMYEHRANFSNYIFISNDYAQFLFDYKYDDKNYYLRDECMDSNHNSALREPNTLQYKYSSYKYNYSYEIGDNDDFEDTFVQPCYIVIGDDKQFVNEILKGGGIEIFSEEKPHGVIPYDSTFSMNYRQDLIQYEFPIMLATYGLALVVLSLVSALIAIVYLILFNRYEFIRFIYDRSYIFMSRYMIVKMSCNIIMLAVSIITTHYLFVISYIIVDIVLYLLLRRVYIRRLIKLGVTK